MDFTQTIWNDNSYQAYIEYLKSLADDKYKEFNSKITPISYESQIYGVRAVSYTHLTLPTNSLV